MTEARHSGASRGRLSIGDVISQLSEDFPGLSISKIRFLEAEGLVEPERTASGYRKFSREDVERLRYVLTAQRDHYLPLKVIREHLDAMDRGLEPPPLVSGEPQVPRLVTEGGAVSPESFTPGGSSLRLSRKELVSGAGVEEQLLETLEQFGLVTASPSGHFDSDALELVRTAGELAAYGVEPRHLRAFRTAAARDVGLIEQVVNAVRRSRDPGASARAEQVTGELAALLVRLYGASLRTALRPPGS